MSKQFKWAANPNYVGKCSNYKDATFGWMNLETTPEQFYEFVAKDGLSFTCWLTNGHRKNENFVCTDIIGVDVDDGMQIEDLENDELYQAYGGGYYTTGSHTEEHHRFRIFFFLEETIDHPIRINYLYRSLIRWYGADDACKDQSRFFFGTPNAARSELREDKLLPKDIMDDLIQIITDEEVAEAKRIQEQIEWARSQERWRDEWNDGDAPTYNVEDAPYTAENGRHNMLVSEAGKMITKGVSLADALNYATVLAGTRCMPALNPREAMDTVRDCYKRYRR